MKVDSSKAPEIAKAKVELEKATADMNRAESEVKGLEGALDKAEAEK